MPDGTTDIDAVVVRWGKNLEGRVLGAALRTVGTRVLAKEFAKRWLGTITPLFVPCISPGRGRIDASL
ncbi:hypothetical protein H5400_04785 [Rhodococcus wratislaviensis]|nr:hypothetical protein [Rhodococcus sp. 3A]MBC2897039.1 hypothetical protein [Rhodococcus sp. 4CII]